jgi:hypothetical protein
MDSSTIPELPRYVGVAQAARILGIAKVSVYYKIYEQRKFATVYRVGGDEEGIRPFLLLAREEVEAELEAMRLAENSPPRAKTLAQQRLEWNRRVKEWGLNNSRHAPFVRASGQPRADLVQAYLRTYPDDVMPV